MATYLTDAEETRERICPDIIISRGQCRQLRLHQYKGEKVILRSWIKGHGRDWAPQGAGVRLHVWEMRELLNLMPDVIETRLEHAARFATKQPDSVNSPRALYAGASAYAADIEAHRS